jgi:hypothetical protein
VSRAKLGDLVVVCWLDSRQPVPHWRFVDDLEHQPAVQCSTVGWLVQLGSNISLAQALGDVGQPEQQCAGVATIPACSIVSMRRLRTGKHVKF